MHSCEGNQLDFLAHAQVAPERCSPHVALSTTTTGFAGFEMLYTGPTSVPGSKFAPGGQ